jgi:hypothetical protein
MIPLGLKTGHSALWQPVSISARRKSGDSPRDDVLSGVRRDDGYRKCGTGFAIGWRGRSLSVWPIDQACAVGNVINDRRNWMRVKLVVKQTFALNNFRVIVSRPTNDNAGQHSREFGITSRTIPLQFVRFAYGSGSACWL